jgi:hypothetical protein
VARHRCHSHRQHDDGGAFAVVPLIAHLIDEPIDAGVFVAGSWYVDHRTPPGPADFASAKPWRGYSVQAFQTDVLTRPLTGYRIDPLQPLFKGPVFVLTSARSLSAAEIATDAVSSRISLSAPSKRWKWRYDANHDASVTNGTFTLGGRSGGRCPSVRERES